MRQPVRLDRRTSASLLAELLPGGALESLVRVCHEQPELFDLLPARSRSGSRSSVTLSGGRAALVSVDERNGLFRIRSHPGPAEHIGRPEHEGWMTSRRLQVVWGEVARDLGVVLASTAMARALADPPARVAAALGPAPDGGIRVIARWVGLDATGPDSPISAAAESVRRALSRDRDGRSWWPRPRRSVDAALTSGPLADVLASDSNGRLLTITTVAGEQVPAGAPVRSVLAAEAVARSVALDPTSPAHLDELLVQRAGLGIVRAPGRPIATGPRVTPVLALPAGTPPEELEQIEEVVRSLSDRIDADPWVDPVEILVGGRGRRGRRRAGAGPTRCRRGTGCAGHLPLRGPQRGRRLEGDHPLPARAGPRAGPVPRPRSRAAVLPAARARAPQPAPRGAGGGPRADRARAPAVGDGRIGPGQPPAVLAGPDGQRAGAARAGPRRGAGDLRRCAADGRGRELRGGLGRRGAHRPRGRAGLRLVGTRRPA